MQEINSQRAATKGCVIFGWLSCTNSQEQAFHILHKGACQDKLSHKAKKTILISEERFMIYDL